MKKSFLFLSRLINKFSICCMLMAFAVIGRAENVCDSLSARYVGNWINKASCVWEFGLYERFAIFDTDFWEYKKIECSKRQVSLTLAREGKEVVLRLRKTKAGEETLEIAHEKNKFVPYRLAKKGFIPYPDKDSTFFPTYRYGKDSITILGYYRNWDKLPKASRFKVIELGRNDFLVDEMVKVYADLDSCGRFQMRLPVTGLEEVYIDWKFMGKSAYVVPGEKLLVYADVTDLMKRERMATREEYWKYDSDVWFMGENARFHNEMSHCPSALDIRGYYDFENKNISDMEILKAMEGDYLDYLKIFEQHLERYPTLSWKCISMTKEGVLYRFAFNMMQNQYRLIKKKRLAFESGYMEFVKSKFPLDVEWYYLASHYLSSFVKDYIGYYESLRDQFLPNGLRFSLTPIQPKDVLEYIKLHDLASSEELELIDRYQKGNKELDSLLIDTVARKKLIERESTVLDWGYEYLNSETVKDIDTYLTTRKVKESYDTLIPFSYLKELQIGRYYMQLFDRQHKPLSDRMLTLLESYVQNPAIRERIMEENRTYQKIANKEITWLESLKSTEHLKEYKDAKTLFQKLIEPYKGTVIYLDIWGTWCQPCRDQMAYVKGVKEALKGKKVTYMYLANRSEEKLWKRLISEYDLSGENIVHYRLPEDQQDMVERLLNVTHFPTFILLDKEGNIANPKAPRPQEKKQLVDEILKLLAH